MLFVDLPLVAVFAVMTLIILGQLNHYWYVSLHCFSLLIGGVQIFLQHRFYI